jgi:hypothetical protein
MADQPTQKELEDKVFTDEEGEMYQGQRFIDVPDVTRPEGFSSTEVWYKDGKIHGTPGIRYPDGLEEDWNHGKFVIIRRPPYHLR